ncbi:MAG: zinc ribbon domain-containing protein [Candidatus Thermoplasmatota archaeon]
MKLCIKCGASLTDESQYCNVCGASQAVGAYRVAEVAGMLGRGAFRAGFGAFFGGFAAWAFYMILLSYKGQYFVELSGGLDALTLGGYPALIFSLIIALICAICSAPSWKFAYLVGYWAVYSYVGVAIWFFVGWGVNLLLAKIIYIVLLLTLLPLTWIWYLAQKGLLAVRPVKGGFVASVKHELKDTFREVNPLTRFGRKPQAAYAPTMAPPVAPSATYRCVYCGRELALGTRFCHYCGQEQRK